MIIFTKLLLLFQKVPHLLIIYLKTKRLMREKSNPVRNILKEKAKIRPEC